MDHERVKNVIWYNPSMKPCIMLLPCADSQEAQSISHALLEQKLIACAKMFPVTSAYLWLGKKESANEILVIFESVEENFEKIEQIVKKMHSYETFVLYSLPISQTTKSVKKWLKDELKT